jgi:hypothetical protein
MVCEGLTVKYRTPSEIQISDNENRQHQTIGPGFLFAQSGNLRFVAFLAHPK